MNTITQLVIIPSTFTLRLDVLQAEASKAIENMLADRTKSSSKFYSNIPCVLAKSLITKYQRNQRCQSVKHLVLPICGDKGRQVKLAEGGFRIPAVFGKAVIPAKWRHPIDGYIAKPSFCTEVVSGLLPSPTILLGQNPSSLLDALALIEIPLATLL